MTEQPAQAVRPERMTVPWGLPTLLGAFILSLAVAVIGDSILLKAGHDLEVHHHIVWEALGYQFLALGVLLSAVLLVVIPYHVGPAALGYRFPGLQTMTAAASSVVAIYAGVYVITLLFTKLLPGYGLHGNAAQLIPGHHHHFTVLQNVAIVLWAAVEAPLTEETLFRGIIFQGVREFFSRWIPYQGAVFVGAVISGGLFGLVHLEPHTLPILVFLGIALAYIFQFSRSIFGSAIVHAIINGISVIVALQS